MTVRLLLARYRGGLFLGLTIAPILVGVLMRTPGSDGYLTTRVGLPLYGDGRVDTWVVLSMYVGIVAGPLLAWRNADIEVSAPRFRRSSFYVPYLMALAMAVIMLAAVSSGPSLPSAVFWVSASMATAHLWALLLPRVAWAGVLVSALLALSMVLQQRVDVWRTGPEAAVAGLAWLVLGGAGVWRQRRNLVRP